MLDAGRFSAKGGAGNECPLLGVKRTSRFFSRMSAFDPKRRSADIAVSRFLRKFEERHPVGSKARLAFALLLFTGDRRSDVTRLGHQNVHKNVEGETVIRFAQFEGRNRKPRELELPLLPILQETIDASPTGDLVFLVNDLGQPFTDNGFGNWFRDRCIEAGVPGRAHGLRKAGATIAADNEATTHELMAIFGWTSLAMAEKYTRAANQKKLARSAMHRLVPPEQTRTESCPTDVSSGTFSKKTS